jgi:dihydroorotate dehydrogenase (NAD+) catalytic subunit
VKAPDLRVNIAGVTLANPVLTASGTSGTGEELSRIFNLKHLGGFVTKSVSVESRAGHPPPRLAETAAGMLNCIGLPNVGLTRFLAEKMPLLRKLKTRIVINIVGRDIADYRACAERLNRERGIDFLELNLSCPNVREGLNNGADPAWVRRCLAQVRRVTNLPLIAKLTPNTHDIAALARAAEAGGADAVSAINTLLGTAINIKTRRPRLSNVTGGLSGPAIKPVALACVLKIAQAVKIPVIGIGGISSGADAVEFLLAGASAVQIGTATFREPRACLQVIAGLRDYLREHKIAHVTELIGAVELS